MLDNQEFKTISAQYRLLHILEQLNVIKVGNSCGKIKLADRKQPCTEIYLHKIRIKKDK